MGLLGFEPRTYGLKVRCSNQLSYSPTTILQGPAGQATGPQNGRKPRWHGRKQAVFHEGRSAQQPTRRFVIDTRLGKGHGPATRTRKPSLPRFTGEVRTFARATVS